VEIASTGYAGRKVRWFCFFNKKKCSLRRFCDILSGNNQYKVGGKESAPDKMRI
jgi:hypothetical protein